MLVKFLQKLKERRDLERTCRNAIAIYRTGTAEERQQLEDVLWQAGRESGDMVTAEAAVEGLRKLI